MRRAVRAITQDELLYIATVARLGSIAKAAEELFITRSAVSRCIKKVETEYNTALIKRTPKGIILTPAGEVYVHYAQKILHDNAEMESRIREVSKTKTGQVMIGTTYSVASSILPSVFRMLRANNPKIKCGISDNTITSLEDQLRHGKLDFLISLFIQKTPGFKYKILTNEILCIVFPRVCSGEEFTDPVPNLERLLAWGRQHQLPAYLTKSHFLDRQVVDRVLVKHGIQLPEIHEMSSYYSILGLVAGGFGFTAAPYLNCMPYLNDRRLIFLPIAWGGTAGTIAAAYPGNTPMTPAARVVLQYCSEAFADTYQNNIFQLKW